MRAEAWVIYLCFSFCVEIHVNILQSFFYFHKKYERKKKSTIHPMIESPQISLSHPLIL